MPGTTPAAYYDQRWRLFGLRSFGLGMAALVVITDPIWGEMPLAQKAIRFAGAALVIGAVFGRLWAILYIGGRKNVMLMTAGPYSITRNPLYFFSTVGSVGAGLGFGSIALGVIAGFTIGSVLYATSRGEAALLRSHFGERYNHYAERVPLFWPNPCVYRDEEETSFQPGALRRALGDAVLFLLVIPAAEMTELLRHFDLLPRLFSLP